MTKGQALINLGIRPADESAFSQGWDARQEEVDVLEAELAALKESLRRRKFPEEKPEPDQKVIGFWRGEATTARYAIIAPNKYMPEARLAWMTLNGEYTDPDYWLPIPPMEEK